MAQKDLAAWREEHTPRVCPIGGHVLTNPVVDHSHDSCMIRGVIDGEINAFMGRIENAYVRLSPAAKTKPLPELLRSVADFLEARHTLFIHPKGAASLVRRFKRAKKDDQIAILEGLRQIGKKVTTEDILGLRNTDERAKLYRKLITQDQYQPKKNNG